MKRDNITPTPIYFSPPSPNITFSAYNHRLPHRESLPLDQHIPINRGQEFQQRYSNTIDSSQPNNAFAHLRNQISNLRSQFTKLIQKDGAKDEKVNFGTYKKEERVTAHSTIGFYNQNDIKAENKPENKNDLASLKNRLAANEAKNSNEDGKTKKDESKYQKKYSFQVQDKKEENVTLLDATKISELQVEIRKLGEIKFKAEEENIALKKQLNRMEKELANKSNGLDLQNQKLKKSVEQAQISISLKNSLVEKLESEHQNFKQLIKYYESQNNRLQYELQNCRKDLQAARANHKSELERMHQRHEQQVKHLESIHQTNITEIVNQLVASQKEERAAQLAHSLKEDECQQLKKENSRFQEQCQAQTAAIKSLQINIQELKSQGNLDQKTKTLEDENNDLKKRVESYKKTVEQLNSSNNSGRDKLLIAKEEAKKYKEEAKFLAEELSVKQKLITSLYRDINILDAEIRHNTLLKSVLASNSRYIEELNQHIVELQCERLNAKYREMADFSISPSF